MISKSTLIIFAEAHPDALDELLDWHAEAERCTWGNHAEVKASFPDVDRVGRFDVLNICRNRYRPIANIHHNRGKVFIHAVLTHQEHDRRLWKD